jgi:NAD(P)H-hydrate epimerase
MIPVHTSEQVRAMDAAVIEGAGLPGRVLMEIAGRGVAEIVQERFPRGPVAVLCGPGNNGGDGHVVARWLSHWGRDVRIWSAPARTPDSQANRSLCDQMSLPVVDLQTALDGVSVAVDALLGTGQRGAVHGEIAEAVAAMAAAPRRVSVDIPTGVCADTGQALGPVVDADLTVTLGKWKRGLLCAPGCRLAGDIYCVDIGLDLATMTDPSHGQADAWLLERADVDAWRPFAAEDAAKWDRGHVAIRAGGGAAVLAAHGAFRGGAGMVTLLAPRCDWEHMHGLWPEVILAEPETLDPERHDVVVVGPGLGTDKVQVALRLWNEFPGAVVADADALSIMASHPQEVHTPSDCTRLITPHAAEAARLLGGERADIEADRFTAIRRLSSFGVAVLKGPHTLIGSDRVWVNPTGSARLATAGTGDVLAGMIGGAIAAGAGAPEAAAVSVWDHGLGGQRMPPSGTASDLIAALAPRQGAAGESA